jgi:hypothetical protein
VEKDANYPRSIIVCGYVRGTHLRSTTVVHLVGVGDYTIKEINSLPDPCPLPEKAVEHTVRIYLTY